MGINSWSWMKGSAPRVGDAIGKLSVGDIIGKLRRFIRRQTIVYPDKKHLSCTRTSDRHSGVASALPCPDHGPRPGCFPLTCPQPPLSPAWGDMVRDKPGRIRTHALPLPSCSLCAATFFFSQKIFSATIIRLHQRHQRQKESLPSSS